MLRRNWIVLAVIVFLMLFIYTTRAILLPFVLGLAVAYLLDPLADKLETYKFPRWAAAATILSLFFVLFISAITAMVPLLQTELKGIAQQLPEYIASLRPYLDDLIQNIGVSFGGVSANTDSLLAEMADTSMAKAGDVLNGILSKGGSLFNMLALLLISPVVAFFLLRDWDLIVAKVDGWLPRSSAMIVRRLASQVDGALAGFVRGQTTVALIMATLYSIGWSFVGLDYALILGILAGVLAFIPFAGAVFALILAIIVALGQMGGDAGFLGQVFAVFVVVQILEGAVLTPRLIGEHVGLHPVWVLFAIFAGGEVMGFVGILIALPVAASVGVLVRYFIERYLDSTLHKGLEGEETS